MKHYYICQPGGIQEGPYPEDMLRACYAEGIYPEGTVIWCEGMDAWQSISLLAQPSATSDESAASPAPDADEIPPAQPEDAPQPVPKRTRRRKVGFNKKLVATLCAASTLSQP